MALNWNKIFLIIALLALPNMYYHAEYNVPLLLFCYVLWQKNIYKPTIIYVVIFSWIIDLVVIIVGINEQNQQKQGSRPFVIYLLLIVVFVLKVIAMIFLIIKDPNGWQNLRWEALSDSYIQQNDLFKPSPR